MGRYPQSPHDIYVVSDRQALSWQSVDSQFVADWKRRMRGSSPNTRMFVLPVGSADADNIAVESVKLLNPPAIAGQQTDIEVVVRNYGSVQHAAIPVSIDGVKPALPERYVSLAGGQSLAVPFSITFKEAGSQVLSARVKSAGYTGDDQLDMVVNVIPPIRVLVISGDERSGQTHGASDYLRWALAPHAANGVVGGDPCVVAVVPADQWDEADLRKYQVVVLANVERFTAEQATAIGSYVYGGGRLLIAPGSLSRVDNYNTRFYHEGGGILPALLLPPTAADGSDATSLLGLQTDHPVFQFMRGRMELPAATITRYFPTIPAAKRLERAGSLSEQRPVPDRRTIRQRPRAAVDHGPGQRLDHAPAFQLLPASSCSPPIRASRQRRRPDGNLPPGKVIQLRFDDSKANRTVWVMRPDGKSSKLEVVFRPEKPPEVRYPHTELPGTYRVQVQEAGKTQNVYFIVRPPREESDLTQLPEDRWQYFERALGFTRVDPTVRPVMESLAANREGRDLWGPALAAMLVLTVLEMCVARIGSVQQQKEDRVAATEMAGREEVEISA